MAGGYVFLFHGTPAAALELFQKNITQTEITWVLALIALKIHVDGYTKSPLSHLS